MMPDYRDVCIATLADELTAAQALAASRQADIQVLWLIIHALMAHAHELYRENAMISSRQYVYRKYVYPREAA